MKEWNEDETADFVDHVAQKVRTVRVLSKVNEDTYMVFVEDPQTAVVDGQEVTIAGTHYYAQQDDLYPVGESGYESLPDDPDEIILSRSADRTKVIIEAPQQEDSPRIELSRDAMLELVVRLTQADLEWDR